MAHTKRHRPTWPLRRQHRRPWYFDANVRRRQPTLLLWPVLKRMNRLIKLTGGRPRSSSVRWTRQSRARATSLGTLQPLHFLMQSQARQTTSVRQMHQQMHQLHHHHHPHANMLCSNMRAVVILNGYGGTGRQGRATPMQQTAKQNAARLLVANMQVSSDPQIRGVVFLQYVRTPMRMVRTDYSGKGIAHRHFDEHLINNATQPQCKRKRVRLGSQRLPSYGSFQSM